jgi:hypothetical protein
MRSIRWSFQGRPAGRTPETIAADGPVFMGSGLRFAAPERPPALVSGHAAMAFEKLGFRNFAKSGRARIWRSSSMYCA